MNMEFNDKLTFTEKPSKEGYSWYEGLKYARTAYTFDLIATRLMEKDIVRVKMPSEIRNQFVEELLEMRSIKFQSQPWVKLSNILAHYVAQDDSFANKEAGIWRAPCSNLEYSYFSNRMDRYIADENYLKETSLEYATFIQEDFAPNFEELGESNIKMIIETTIEAAGLSSIEEAVWRAHKLDGWSTRAIAERFSMSKTSSARFLKNASEKVEAAYWRASN